MTDLEVAVCLACELGYHGECYDATPEGICCCVADAPEADVDPFADEPRGPGRPMSDPANVTDILSTGRKRAAMVAPIIGEMTCEWAHLAKAGGGVHPIVGCRGNTITETRKGPTAGHRHHGPDKNTLNNAVGINLHRICTTCHNRWHALNNKTYHGDRPSADTPWYPEGDWAPHDPLTTATEEDYDASDTYWASRP